MVANPGAPDSGGRLRPLNRPQPIEVETDDDACPAAIVLSGQRRAVEEVLQTWLIEDEWWRERSVSRLYYSLLLEDGRVVTLYHDRVGGSWWKQSY